MSAGRRSIDLDDDAALARRHAGGRLVEQQHLGLEAERHGDLDQALPAIGELATGRSASSARPRRLEQRIGLLDDGAMAPGGPHQIAGDAARARQIASVTFSSTLRPAEQRVDLKGAGEAALDPRRLRQRGDVGAVEQDAPGARRAARR